MTWSWVGNSYQFVEYEDWPKPGQPHCQGCGKFLSWKPAELDYIYGDPGKEITEKRWARPCKHCKGINWDD